MEKTVLSRQRRGFAQVLTTASVHVVHHDVERVIFDVFLGVHTKSLGCVEIEQLLCPFGGGLGLGVREFAGFHLFGRAVIDFRQAGDRLDGVIQHCQQLVVPESALAPHGFRRHHSYKRIAHHNVPVQVGQGQSGDEGSQPQGHDGDLCAHRAYVHSENAVLQQQSAEKGGVINPCRPRGAGAKAVEIGGHAGKRGFSKETDRHVRQCFHDLHQEVGATTSGIQHCEGEELPYRSVRIGGGGRPHLLQVTLESGDHRTADQVLDQLGRGVVDTSRLAAALVGLPQQAPGVNFRVGVVGDVTVFIGVIAKRLVGHRQAETQQSLVDVAEVTYLQGGVIHSTFGLTVPADRSEKPCEVGIGQFHALQEFGALEVGRRKQGAVVCGDIPGGVAVTHRPHQHRELRPKRGGVVAELVL